jgi:hypothetical protein
VVDIYILELSYNSKLSIGDYNLNNKPQHKYWKRLLILFNIIILGLIFIAGSATAYTPQSRVLDGEPTLDGEIEDTEYEFTAEFGGGDYRLHWLVNGETIFMAIEGRTNGWVAIGIEPKDIMEDADMIFGWVTDSDDVIVLDCYSLGPRGPHPPDTEQGGTDDILADVGSELSGWTIIEFKRLLETEDNDFDKKLREKGDIEIIWALGSTDDFELKHRQAGYGSIDLATGKTGEGIIGWPIHAIFMILGFCLMVIASIVSHYMKKHKWWLRAHKTMNIFASIFAVLGLLMAIYMVENAGGDHFGVPHAYIGIFTIIFVIIPLIIGFTMMRGGASARKLRILHRNIGRIAIILMVLNILIGLSLVDIF